MERADVHDAIGDALARGVVTESWILSMLGTDAGLEGVQSLVAATKAVEVVSFAGTRLQGWWSTDRNRLVDLLRVAGEVVPCTTTDLRILLGDLPIPSEISVDLLLAGPGSPVSHIPSMDLWVSRARPGGDIYVYTLREADHSLAGGDISARLPADIARDRGQLHRDPRLVHLQHLDMWILSAWRLPPADLSGVETRIVQELGRLGAVHPTRGGLDELVGVRGGAEALERLLAQGRVGRLTDGSYALVTRGARALISRKRPNAPKTGGPRNLDRHLDQYCLAIQAISRAQWGPVLTAALADADTFRALESRVMTEVRIHLGVPELNAILGKATRACQPYANLLRWQAESKRNGALKEMAKVVELTVARGAIAVTVASLGSPGLGRELYRPLESAARWRWGGEGT